MLSQTYQDFEIVSSTTVDRPATQALLADYRRPGLASSGPAAGLAGAEIWAIANATGEYLCALDADDSLEPTYFEKTVPFSTRTRQLPTCPPGSGLRRRSMGVETGAMRPSALLWEDTVLTAALVRREAVVRRRRIRHSVCRYKGSRTGISG